MPSKRCRFLTVMAILLAFVALDDVLKPSGGKSQPTPASFPSADPPRHRGSWRASHRLGRGYPIIGPLVGVVLVLYAVGIWRMKRYAVAVAWIYAAYVILNLALFTIRNPPAPTRGEMICDIVNSISAIVLTVGTAIALTRHGHHLARLRR
jgi:hypothetical protein